MIPDSGRVGQKGTLIRRGVLFVWTIAVLLPAFVLAAPRVWVEARVEPRQVPVNFQATYVLRFGHAVDVPAPQLGSPRLRLAEVIPLESVPVRNEVREGLRYRVHEKRFAVLPFASGSFSLESTVSGTTPATLPELGGAHAFNLPAPGVLLSVTPAVGDAGWLPARDVRWGVTPEVPPPLRVGQVWSRVIEISADGVDGGVIPPPTWAVSEDWSLQFDPPEQDRRVEAGRIIGTFRQTFHAQPRRAGRLAFPEMTLNWWRWPEGQAAQRVNSPVMVDVLPDDGRSSKQAMPSEQGSEWPWRWLLILAGAIFGVIFWRLVRHAFWRPRWQRWVCWRRLRRACLASDPLSARQALLAWDCHLGPPARSLEALSARVNQDSVLVMELIALDAACFGVQSASAAPWNGVGLYRALRRHRRHWQGTQRWTLHTLRESE